MKFYLDKLLNVILNVCFLQLSYNESTPGDGACFYHCLVNQISREDIAQENSDTLEAINLKAKQKYLENYGAQQKYNEKALVHRPTSRYKYITAWSLRQLVCDLVEFWLASNFTDKQDFLQMHSEVSGKTIERLVELHRSDKDWAEDLFIDTAVHLLKVPILMITEHSTVDNPYPIEKGICYTGKTPIYIGSWDNRHFQSFMPKHLLDVNNTSQQVNSAKDKPDDLMSQEVSFWIKKFERDNLKRSSFSSVAVFQP